jgi:hypothetical protein
LIEAARDASHPGVGEVAVAPDDLAFGAAVLGGESIDRGFRGHLAHILGVKDD